MNDVTTGLLIGFGIGVAFALFVLLLGAAIAGRRDDRAQTEWDVDVDQAVRLTRPDPATAVGRG